MAYTSRLGRLGGISFEPAPSVSDNRATVVLDRAYISAIEAGTLLGVPAADTLPPVGTPSAGDFSAVIEPQSAGAAQIESGAGIGLLATPPAPQAAFTTGSLVVVRVGSGSGALSSVATQVFLDEFTTGGVLVQSLALPTSISGADRALTLSGSATSEGGLSRSADGRFLLLAGYDAAPGTAGVVATTSTATPRVIARVGNAGTIDTTTSFDNQFGGNNIRSVASLNGTDLYAVGANSGVVYTTFGASSGTSIATTPVANFRVVQIFDGQLYASSSSGTTRLTTVGTGTPTTAGQTATNLTGFPTTGSPYGYFFADLDAGVAGVDTLYVADDGIGLTKYSLVGGSWTSNGVIGTNADDYRGLAGRVVSGTVELYATLDNGASSDTIVRITDASGYNGALTGTATVIATAATNTAFRGIAFAPQAPENQTISLSAVTASQAEGDAGNTVYQFTVTRTGGTSGDLNFTGTFAAGQTTAADFAGGVLPGGFNGTIPAGQTSATVTINVAGDTVVETSESFSLTLTGGTSTGNNVAIGTASATATIVNDDAAGGVVINGQTVFAQADSTLTGSAAVPVATNAIQLTRLGNLAGTGATATGRAESVAFNAANATLYVTNVPAQAIDRYVINADGSLTLGAPISLAGLTQYGSVNSVAVRGGIIAVTYDNVTAGTGGYLVLFDTATGTLQRTIQVGATPDQVVFTPDGSRILIANEAEAVSNASNAPGSISIIDVSGGAAAATIQSTISFAGLNGGEAALRSAGLPIFAGQQAGNDIEPEYITVSPDGTRAYVTLQEVNGVAVIDLTNTALTAPIAILPLGYVDRNLAGNQFDPSDQNGINLANWNVRSLLQPDAIASFTVGGVTYFVTANEGDARVGTGLVDEIRLGNAGYDLDNTLFPNEATLKLNTNLGRLNVLTNIGDTDGDLDFDQIYTEGGRGITIFRQNADGTITKVRETGGEFERIIAANYASRFNIDSGGTAVDDRSDNKGPEPEGVTIGTFNGRTYAFVSLERAGGVIVYDVTDPANANYVSYIPAVAPTAGGDSAPEVITFIDAASSPTGTALVVTANEGSGTVTVYRVEAGNANAQTVNGGAGDDTRTGGPAGDTFDFSQGGNDVVFGLDGNDSFFFGAAFTSADRVDGGAGTNDQVGLQGDYSAGLTLNAASLTNVEVLAVLPGFSYSITTVDANVPAGGTLTFFGGNLAAGNNFTFNGAAETNGAFRVYGGLGTDNFTGGAGDDGFYFGPGRFDGAVDRVNGGAGTNDQLALDGTYDITLTSTQIQGIETIALLPGTLSDPGSYTITLDDTLIAGAATLNIWALNVTTAVTLNGAGETSGTFNFIGGTVADTITGGAGADIFFGGLGGDTLTGNGGADTFRYTAVNESTGVNYDRIVGFVSGTDRIDLPGTVTAIAPSITTGSLSTASFNADLAAIFGAGQLGANNAALFTADAGTLAGQTFLVVDANGIAGYQADADYVIQLVTPPPVVVTSDFI